MFKQLFVVVWDGLWSVTTADAIIVSWLFAVDGFESSNKPSKLRDRFGTGGGVLDIANDEIGGVFDPLREYDDNDEGYCGGKPRGNLLLELIIQLRGLFDL